MMRRWIVVNALCCAAALVACGGDDESPPAGAEGRTKAEWADEVNATCREGNAEARRIVGQVRKEKLSPVAFAAESLERSAPATRRILERQRAIEAPPSLRSDFSRYISDLEDAVTLIAQFAEAIRSQREDRVRAFQRRFKRVAAETRPFAIEHGLTDCLNK